MAHVTGPTSSLPGSRHNPQGQPCDHPGCTAPATVRIQGETDSMGAEYLDFCDAHIPPRDAPLVGTCDWCRTPNVALSITRDYDEGMCGPVYEVCKSCTDRRNAEAEAELARYGRDDDDYFDDGDY